MVLNEEQGRGRGSTCPAFSRSAEIMLIFLFGSGPGASAPQFTLVGRGGRALSHPEPKPVASRHGMAWLCLEANGQGGGSVRAEW